MPDYALARAGGQEVGGTVEALLLRFPTAVRSIQRRKSFRVPVDGTTGLEAKVWTMSGTASLREKPVASREISCDVRDISVGGIGLLIRGAAGRPPAVASGDRIRVQLTLGRTVVLLEGQLRYPPRATKDSTFRAGVQFLSFGESKEDRAASAELGKIVNQLQRELIRRKKLGLPVPAA
jgi:c-di-GMP-binding flagellar brake protein YcgR